MAVDVIRSIYPFPFTIISISLISIALLTCGGSSEVPTAQDVLIAAHARGSEVTSYFSQFTTGIGKTTLGQVQEIHEFHRPGIVVGRNSQGDITYIRASSNIEYTPSADDAWCKRPSLGRDSFPDRLDTVPSALSVILSVENLPDSILGIEGFESDPVDPTNATDGAVLLHRLEIDSAAGYVIGWTQWSGFLSSLGELESASAGGLSGLANSIKQDPWNRFDFSRFNELDPVSTPELLDESCSS